MAWALFEFYKHKKCTCLVNKVFLMYQSFPSLTNLPSDPQGFAHSSCPWGRVFAPPLSRLGVVFNQSKSSIILKKKRDFCFVS